jgi:hypothetical protein
VTTKAELLTNQFYSWEMRGRGWTIWPSPVEIEPPFRPFWSHSAPLIKPEDDGQNETILSCVGDFVLELLGKEKQEEEPHPEIQEPEARPLAASPELFEFQTFLPANLDISSAAFEDFLTNIHLIRHPLTFELIGNCERVSAQFVASTSDASILKTQLQAYFPDVVFNPLQGFLERLWISQTGDAVAVEFGLGREFMYPLGTGKLDPFIGIISALAGLASGEVALYQVMFKPVRSPWGPSIKRAVEDGRGGSFLSNKPELPHFACRKISQPLFAVVLRIAAKTSGFDRLFTILREIATSLRVFASPEGNELIPLKNGEYPLQEHLEDVILRRTRRTGMILNKNELVGLVHFPSKFVRSAKLARITSRTHPAPHLVQRGGVLLGVNEHGGEARDARLLPVQRAQHCHIIGASGTGKSTLLFNLIEQDMESGDGLAVLDPHGDLVEKILGLVPDHRVNDVIVFDPADEEYSIGFNILSAHSDSEKRLLASDLVSIFRRLSSNWGDQMGSVFSNAILAFLESRQTGTLADLRRFLLDAAFRETFLNTVADPDLVYYWRKAFPQLSGNRSIGPVLTRLEAFLGPKSIRYMVSQKENRLDFGKIMDTGKIFLAKLSHGLIGKENSYLLGSLLVSKFQQLAMSRQRQSESSRRYFWLYIDEFQNFITPSMAEILSGARKYHMGLILAHHELRQLDCDKDVASAVLSHCYTRIFFRVGDADAKQLENGLSHFEARDLQNLDTGRAICRVERSDFDFNLKVTEPKAFDAAAADARRNEIVEASRRKYGIPRKQVESLLRTDANLSTSQTSKERTPQKEEELKTSNLYTPTENAPKKPKFLSELGKGGTQHKALQRRLKSAAEKLGFQATIEKEIPSGSIDLFLERGDISIACEISITTTIDHEVGNIQKCLKVGCTFVAVICPDASRLPKIETAVLGCLEPEAGTKVRYFEPEQFIQFLSACAKQGSSTQSSKQSSLPSEGIRRGRKVKRAISDLSPEEREAKEKAIIAALTEHMKGKPHQ